MPKKKTRIDSATLRNDVHEARLLILAAIAKVQPHLIRLTPEERASLLRPLTGFTEKAPALLRAAKDHPQLAAVVDFDTEAVEEDLANVEILRELAEPVREFNQDVNDTILVSRDEAYSDCLAFHAVARTAAQRDPALRAAVDPLAPLFARPTRRGNDEG